MHLNVFLTFLVVFTLTRSLHSPLRAKRSVDHVCLLRRLSSSSVSPSLNLKDNEIVDPVSQEKLVYNNTNPVPWLPYAILNGVAIMWGSQHVVIKQSIESFPSTSIVNFWRFVSSTLLFSPALLSAISNTMMTPSSEVSDSSEMNESVRRDGLWSAGFELGVYTFLGFAFQAIGLETTTASKSAFLLYLNVKLVPFLAAVLFKRTIALQTWISAFLAFSGTALLSTDGGPIVIGDVWCIAAAFASAMFILKIGEFSRIYNTSRLAAELNAVSFATVALLCGLWLVFDIANATPSSDLALADIRTLTDVLNVVVHNPLPILYLGVVTTGLCNFLQTLGQRDVPAEKAALIYSLDPVYGAMFSYYFLNEQIGLQGFAGAALILTGVWSASRDIAIASDDNSDVRSIEQGRESVFLVRPINDNHSEECKKENGTEKCITPSTKASKGFNILEQLSSQKLLVIVAKWAWNFIYNVMLLELAPQDKDGAYVRTGYSINNGALGSDRFPVESNRYHLYIGNPCPWCHRVSLAYSLYELQESVGITKAVDDPTRARRGGWCFDKTGSQADPVYGEPDLLGIYNRLTKGGKYVGRATLPLLVDTKTNTIVCNESKDIVRQLRAMSTTRDLAPPNKVAEIEAVSSDIYRVNNGVYKCGFSSKQGAYDYAVTDVFNCLDDINAILEKQRFLTGNTLSEADVFLLPTITRFDAIYHPFFRASKTSISLSYPAIMRWLSDMCAIPNVRDQFDLHDAKRSYYKQLFPLNPSALIPATMEQPYLEILANTKEDPAYASTVFDNK